MSKTPIANFNLAKADLPITLQFFTEKDNTLVMEETIEDAGVFKVPYLAGEHGPVWVRVIFADGRQADSHTKPNE